MKDTTPLSAQTPWVSPFGGESAAAIRHFSGLKFSIPRKEEHHRGDHETQWDAFFQSVLECIFVPRGALVNRRLLWVSDRMIFRVFLCADTSGVKSVLEVSNLRSEI